MIPTKVSDLVFALPEQDRIELARKIVDSIVAEQQLRNSIKDGVKRIEDIVTGRIVGMSEEQFRQAIG